ncbi:unnamed protein product [Notodromas monacha]|uniref:Peroxidase n=1 Tax=Notodromas monacha TaxID=399045 RepID=A0A7R9BQC5_9CRUS|nr:unnamed protein product [Notodromas monacha]CAG0919726.1 unnamed protein product [Notodromas monacha]
MRVDRTATLVADNRIPASNTTNNTVFGESGLLMSVTLQLAFSLAVVGLSTGQEWNIQNSYPRNPIYSSGRQNGCLNAVGPQNLCISKADVDAAFDQALKKLELTIPNHELKRVEDICILSRAVFYAGVILKEKKHKSIAQIDPLTGALNRDPQVIDCAKFQKFRHPQGFCTNSQEYVTWGAALQPIPRETPAYYSGTIGETPRLTGFLGAPLPNARHISVKIFRENPFIHDCYLSVFYLGWGQYFAHDINEANFFSDTPINCCTSGALQRDPDCYPIEVLSRDREPEMDTDCLDFHRTCPALMPGCRMGVRQQNNAATPIPDQSTTYGSTLASYRQVRLNSPDKCFLTPFSDQAANADREDCITATGTSPSQCFVTGDNGRMFTEPVLFSVHVMYNWLHNIIAKKLRYMNPHWDCELVFQTARQQRVTEVTSGCSQLQQQQGFREDFDIYTNPATSQTLGQVGFRYGHSKLQEFTVLRDEHYRFLAIDEYWHWFARPERLNGTQMISWLVHGSLTQCVRKTDRFITHQVLSNLRQVLEHQNQNVLKDKVGHDLGAKNNHRGRDHGLAPYIIYKWKFCKGRRVVEWEDLLDVMSFKTITVLRSVYNHPVDIDAYVGMLSEELLPGAEIGFTAACFLAKQFRRYIIGDHKWYENNRLAFNEEQMESIKESTLAGTMCRVFRMNSIQVRPFLMPHQQTNPRLPCNGFPFINLDPWKDPDGPQYNNRFPGYGQNNYGPLEDNYHQAGRLRYKPPANAPVHVPAAPEKPKDPKPEEPEEPEDPEPVEPQDPKPADPPPATPSFWSIWGLQPAAKPSEADIWLDNLCVSVVGQDISAPFPANSAKFNARKDSAIPESAEIEESESCSFLSELRPRKVEQRMKMWLGALLLSCCHLAAGNIMPNMKVMKMEAPVAIMAMPAAPSGYIQQNYSPPSYTSYNDGFIMKPKEPYPPDTIHPTSALVVKYPPNLCLMPLPASYNGPYKGQCITVKDVDDALDFAIKLIGMDIKDKPVAEVIGAMGDVMWQATVWVVDKFKLDPRVAAQILPHMDVSKTKIWEICPMYYKPDHIKCTMVKYPRITGDCNDGKDEDKASSGRLLRRLLPNGYSLGNPRVSVTGYPLPSARLVSNVVHYNVHANEKFWNWWFIVFGQYMDHEIVLSSNFHQNYKVPNGHYECCSYKGHHDCYPISVPPDDPFYGSYKRSCLNFVRAMPGLWPYCLLGSREQWNSATPVIDASPVYGSEFKTYGQIRDKHGYLLTYNPYPAEYGLKPLPPQQKRRPDYNCDRLNKDTYCFKAGDDRNSLQTSLVVMHVIFLRMHNDYVEQLKYLNPHWSAERLFHEARRIVIAANQHISVNEWLPAMLDGYYLDLYKLRPVKLYRYDYEPDTDPQVSNEFSTAAFRFAHSLIPDEIYYANKNHQVTKVHVMSQAHVTMIHTEKVLFRELQNRADEIYVPGNVDRMMLGALHQPLYRMDPHITDEVRNYLFKGFNNIGEDLASKNIQRGRDHGIRGSIEDLDLWSAGVSEFAYNKGLVAQLRELKKISLARLICDHGDYIESVQRWAMQLPDYSSNKIYSCKSKAIPRINLYAWKEKSYAGYSINYVDTYSKAPAAAQSTYSQPQYPVSYNQYTPAPAPAPVPLTSGAQSPPKMGFLHTVKIKFRLKHSVRENWFSVVLYSLIAVLAWHLSGTPEARNPFQELTKITPEMIGQLYSFDWALDNWNDNGWTRLQISRIMQRFEAKMLMYAAETKSRLTLGPTAIRFSKVSVVPPEILDMLEEKLLKRALNGSFLHKSYKHFFEPDKYFKPDDPDVKRMIPEGNLEVTSRWRSESGGLLSRRIRDPGILTEADEKILSWKQHRVDPVVSKYFKKGERLHLVEVGGKDFSSCLSKLPEASNSGWKGLTIDMQKESFGLKSFHKPLPFCVSPTNSTIVLLRKSWAETHVSGGMGLKSEEQAEMGEPEFHPFTSTILPLPEAVQLLKEDRPDLVAKDSFVCFPLYTILLAANFTEVDYLSLSVNKISLDIAHNFQWDKIQPRVVRMMPGGFPDNETVSLMAQHGYELDMEFSDFTSHSGFVYFGKMV